MKAYVFVNVAPEKCIDVAGRLRAIEGVRSADTCWGLPDIVALVETANLKALQEFVLNKIQRVAGVNQTDTHIVWES